MTTVSNFERGGYRFLPGVFQYSAGVAALPGYQIQRVRFGYPVLLADAFSFTIKGSYAEPTFVIAGSGEAPEGSAAGYAQRAIRSGRNKT